MEKSYEKHFKQKEQHVPSLVEFTSNPTVTLAGVALPATSCSVWGLIAVLGHN